MDTKLKVLFTISCIIAIITIIFGSLISSVLYKREQYLKNPYYFCDGTWECCANESNCDVKKSLEEIKSSGLDTYYASDIYTEGSAYHQNCVLPVMNYVNNYDGSTGVDVSGLYNGGAVQSFVYGKGCTGPGGIGKCADPSYNPQTVPSCQYHSFDAPNASWPLQFQNSNSLPSGTIDPATTNNLNKGNYFSNTAMGLKPDFADIQGYNKTYTPSFNTNTFLSGSGFKVPLTGPGINSEFDTSCLARYNVLRPDKFTNASYNYGCPDPN